MLLLYGVLATPWLILAAASGRGWVAWLFVAELAAIFGLVGIFKLTAWILSSRRVVSSHKEILVLVSLGMLSLVGFWFLYVVPNELGSLLTWVAVLPLVATMRICYIGRDFLFKGSRERPRSYQHRVA
jgi:hypothetical protein